jgi:hypothetical protein
LADELGMRSLQAHCHRGLGTLYSRPDRQSKLVLNCRQRPRCTEIWR